MAIDPATRSSRRTVLKAALGGAAAAAAGALAAPLAVQAADDDPVLVGNAYTGTAPTSFENTDAGETSLAGIHSADGTGVAGSSSTGVGVMGSSVDGAGVWAVSTDAAPSDFTTDPSYRSGVYAASGDTTDAATVTDEIGVYGYSNTSLGSVGVVGHSQDGTGVVGSGSTGVFGIGFWGVYAGGRMAVVGDADVDATGVYGFTGSTAAPDAPAGVGVYARSQSTAQVALKVDGKVQMSRSARVTVSATATVRKVVMSGVTTNSFVVATMQTNVSGLYVRAVTCGTGYFNIWLSKAPGKTVAVAYIVIN
jgi:hypothetical protein